MSIYERVYKLMVSLPSAEGEIHDPIKAAIRGVSTRNLQVVLSYPPKVGGTFLRTALVQLLGKHYQAGLSRGSYANADNARDPYFPLLLNQHLVQGPRPQATVMHLHMYPSRHATDILEVFGIPVVVASRNILDCLVSLMEMHEKAQAEGRPMDDALLHSGRSYYEMSPQERRHSLVHIAPLWYARFYGQWLDYQRRCLAEARRPPLWLHYEQLRTDPHAVLASIAAHVDPDHAYTTAELDAALEASLVDRDRVRLNQGISGRGEAFFSAAEKQAIRAILACAGEAALVELGVL
ncbi:MBL fold metallo-hydrolase [Caulobacter hibisci]|uniref:Sulfotransferase domain-containing protein n=1 Tax=Caulobacter hibisci TaxID=2035993 RepID=A0ABS0SXV8_9CAUL|nr:hypothetical protein [Caulobacter hibisci]MBI1684475.1 hypothetical protein [Caulobacter hibisci]